MPELKNYRLLISHSWDYPEQYEKVEQWLDETKWFAWTNESIPLEKALPPMKKAELKERISNRIRLCNAVIILSGMYVDYSDWIEYEMDEAARMGKPIIGLKPWGQQRVPAEVQEKATVMVGWNSQSLIDAIRNCAL